MPKIVGHIYTLLLVLISWVIFAFEDLGQIVTYLSTMFGLDGASLVNAEAIYYLKNYIIIIVIGIICSIPLLQWWKNRNKKTVTQKKEAIVSVITSLGYVAIVIISTASLVNNSFNPFCTLDFRTIWKDNMKKTFKNCPRKGVKA